MQVLTLSDIPSMLGVLFVSALLFVLVQSRYRRWEVRVMLVSLAAHAVFAVYKLWLTVEVYGGGDMLAYYRHGQEIAAYLRQDTFGAIPAVIKIIFQQEVHLGLSFPIGTGSTGTMQALTGVVLVFVGDSLVTACLAFSLASFFGKIFLYDMFRETLPRRYHLGGAIAALLVPSVIMWSAGIIKEGVTMIGLGLAVLAMTRLFERPTPTEGFRLAVGTVIMGLTKPYVLFVVVIAGGVWLYWHRASGRGGVQVRPLYLVLGMAVSVGGILVLGELFPRFSIENLRDETIQAQFYASRDVGGSTYTLGDYASRSLIGQLTYIPFALFTALFRPVIFEVRNFQMLLSSLETTLLLGATLRIFWKQSPKRIAVRLTGSPLLMFCLVVSVVMGVMTGLTSTNLGTLNRYRMPLMPFFAAMVYLTAAPGLLTKSSGSKLSTQSRRSGVRPNSPHVNGRARAGVRRSPPVPASDRASI